MRHQEVLLRGENRKKQILICALLIALGLLLLHLLRPGTVAAISWWIIHLLASIPGYMGDILDSLQEVVHNISGWYR
jgi:hypothetical protein